jgi:hypothetical protein
MWLVTIAIRCETKLLFSLRFEQTLCCSYPDDLLPTFSWYFPVITITSFNATIHKAVTDEFDWCDSHRQERIPTGARLNHYESGNATPGCATRGSSIGSLWNSNSLLSNIFNHNLGVKVYFSRNKSIFYGARDIEPPLIDEHVRPH